jgi:hypothetical protein
VKGEKYLAKNNTQLTRFTRVSSGGTREVKGVKVGGKVDLPRIVPGSEPGIAQ